MIATEAIRPALGLVAALVVAFASGDARAAGTGAQAQLAEQLFQEGKALEAEGKVAESCAKFEESQKVDPATGTLLNIGLCSERLVKLATAWAAYRAVAAQSRDKRPDRVEMSEKRAASLEGHIPLLVVDVPESVRVPGLEVLIDDVALGTAAFGSQLKVDGGEHRVGARAPGKKPFETTVKLAMRDARERVTIPTLEDLPPPPPEAADRRDGPERTVPATSWKRPVGIGLLIGGGAVLAGGLGFGGAAYATRQRMDGACPQPCVRGSEEQDRVDRLFESANTYANIANVTVAVGAVSALVGAFFFVTAPKATVSRSSASSRWWTVTPWSVGGSF